MENREVLEQTWLFGETISPPVQNQLAEAMVLREYDDEGIVLEDLPPTSVYIINSGEIKRMRNGEVIETLRSGSFFGEERILFDKSQAFDYQTAAPCRIFEIPEDRISGIPVVMWKLLESYEFRSTV